MNKTMDKKVIKLSIMVDIEAEVDLDKGELNNSDKLAVVSEIDAAIRDYEEHNNIYPPNRVDFEIKLLRTYERRY